MTDGKMSSRWADEVDDDDLFIVPPSEKEKPRSKDKSQKETPVSKDGERIKTVSETISDPDTGKKSHITRTFRIERKLVSKGVRDRKRWIKFGQSKRDPSGPNSYTTVVADEVQMQFLASSNKETNNLQEATDSMLAKLQQQQEGKGLVRCRFCQDNHFSAKCPYKDTGIPMSQLSIATNPDRNKVDETKPSTGGYVPPARRGVGGGDRKGESMPNRRDESTVRVSNLPQTMSEDDLQDLCKGFGKIDRIFLAKDRNTGVCKGFAFVTYQSRDSAIKALHGLHNYGYDHLILKAEWSKSAKN